MNHKARKRFGQNFLHDPNVIERIIISISASHDEHLVEIGPGKGALTEHLVTDAGKLDVIELDRDLIPILQERFSKYEQFTIYNTDALKFSFASLCRDEVSDLKMDKLRLVGNLPYNISTPLIFHLLDNIAVVQDMHFMLQKEVVERLTAQPNTKAYGRLSILVQYLCHAEQLFIVPPGAFNPVPKVESAIVRLTPKTHGQDEHKLCNASPENLSFIAKAAFAQRRKTLRNNLKTVLSAQYIEQCGIDPGRRAETLTINEFVSLTNQYVQFLET